MFALAQAPSTPAPERPAAEPAAGPALPVRRVILYKTGVGYFEHLGNVRNRQNITIRFTSAQLNDDENATPTTLIIEHRMQPGWKLAEGQTPVESTVDTQRFRVVLPSAKETVFEVRELRQLDEQETRLDTLQTEIARITTEMEKVRGELGALISSVSFDLTTR